VFGVGGIDQIGVEEKIQGCDGRWDPVMRHPTRFSVDALRDGGVDQISVEVGDVDQIDDNEEDLRSCSVDSV
jgi:hypothetical protein